MLQKIILKNVEKAHKLKQVMFGKAKSLGLLLGLHLIKLRMIGL